MVEILLILTPAGSTIRLYVYDANTSEGENNPYSNNRLQEKEMTLLTVVTEMMFITIIQGMAMTRLQTLRAMTKLFSVQVLYRIIFPINKRIMIL